MRRSNTDVAGAEAVPPKATSERVAKILAEPKSGEITLVLDTNVMTEVFTLQDLSDAAAEAGKPEQGLRSPKVAYRIGRIKYTTLLVWVYSFREWKTASLLHEFMRVLDRRAPPSANTAEVGFTKLVVHFVRDYVLPNWVMANFTEVPEDVANEEADDMLVAIAAREQVPLITHEGHSARGVRDTKKNGKPNIRGKAKAAGVEVYTPQQFIEKLGVVPEVEARNFLNRFRSQRPKYQGEPGEDEQTEEVLTLLFNAYRFILLGDVSEDLRHVPRAPVP